MTPALLLVVELEPDDWIDAPVCEDPAAVSVLLAAELVSVWVTSTVLTACPFELATDADVMTVVVTGSWVVDGVDVGEGVVLSDVLVVDVANVVEVVLSEVVVGGIEVAVVVGSEVVVVSAGVEAVCEMEVVVSATDVEAGSAVELDSGVLVGVLTTDVAGAGVVAATAAESVLSVAVLLTLDADIVPSCLDKLLLGGAMLAAVIEGYVMCKQASQVG